VSEDRTRFNLIAEPWIPCRMLKETGPRLEYLGIEKTLCEAHNIREIVGDSPPVTISLHRLLLAVLHRCLGPLPHLEWQEVWQQGAGRFDAAKITSYLHKEKFGPEGLNIHKRFDLFDGEHPFFQSTNTIQPVPGKHLAQKLLFHDDDSAVLFLHLTNADPAVLTPAQAARWLVTFQAFDLGGLKTRVAGESTYTEPAPLIRAAVALSRGRNLFQTLLLNLHWDDIEYFNGGQKQADKPAWEDTEPVTATTREPLGYLDLLTWQSRRIRLTPQTDEAGRILVKQAVVMAGYSFKEGFERNSRETMIAFQRANSAEAKFGHEPVNFTRGRSLWRDAHALFHHVGVEGQRRHAMLMLDWLDRLEYFGAISDRREIAIDFFGLNMSRAKPLYWRHERLPLPLAYLKSEELCQELRRALNLAEAAEHLLTGAIHRFAALIFIPDNHFKKKHEEWFNPFSNTPAKKSGDDQRKIEKESKRDKDIADFRKSAAVDVHYWPRLESSFRSVLVGLARDLGDWQAQRKRWADAVRRAANQTMREVVDGLGDSTRTLRAAAIAGNWFRDKLEPRLEKYLKGAEHLDSGPSDPDDTDDEGSDE
jgi:CRISPR system Cascade subunit CasA